MVGGGNSKSDISFPGLFASSAFAACFAEVYNISLHYICHSFVCYIFISYVYIYMWIMIFDLLYATFLFGDLYSLK